jgi:hypothetical protein
MFLRRNEGTRTKPVYSDKNEWVLAGNKRLRVAGGAHAKVSLLRESLRRNTGLVKTSA